MKWKWKTILSFGKNKEKSNENINEQSNKYNKQALNVQEHVDKVTDIITGKKPSEHTSHETTKDGKNTKVLTKKFRELMDTVKVMKMSGELDKTSIDVLKGQINSIQNAGRELQRNLKELYELSREQKALRREVIELKQQNRKLDKSDVQRASNSQEIELKEKQISKNEAQIKSLSTGEKAREFSVNIQNSFNKFKTEIAKLETQIKSLEKGQAAQQNIMDQPIPKGLKLQEPLKPSWCDRDAKKKEEASSDKGNGVRF